MATAPHVGAPLSGERTSADGRSARLAEQVRALRTRAGAGRLDRWMLIIGGALMPLGALLIVLGWVGASRTPLPFEQNDYLISGGLLGLGLLVAGGFVYFGYWQTLRIRESREQARELASALGRLEALLSRGEMSLDQGPNGAAPGEFVATASGSIFHRPDCPVVSDRTDLRAVDTERTKLQPCRICTPLAASR